MRHDCSLMPSPMACSIHLYFVFGVRICFTCVFIHTRKPQAAFTLNVKKYKTAQSKPEISAVDTLMDAPMFPAAHDFQLQIIAL